LAITMMIGIATSKFTAITIVTILMTEIVRRQKLKTISIEPLIKLVRYLAMVPFSKTRQAWSIPQTDLFTLRGALHEVIELIFELAPIR
jgi:hypothetical protein